MRQIEWATRNRMRIDTGLRAFDLQVGALGVGNVIGAGQSSGVIRAASTLECNGRRYAPGALQAFDLRGFRGVLNAALHELVAREGAERETILYVFHHRTRSGRLVVHGGLLTETASGEHREIGRVVSPRRGSARVVAVCAEYVSNPPRLVPAGRDGSLCQALAGARSVKAA